MQERIANSNGAEDDWRVTASASGSRLATSPIATGSVIAPLPAELIRFLHENLDRDESATKRAHASPLLSLKAAFEERLFPLSDQRRFVVRLRLHSHVTAIAADLVSSRIGQPRKTGFVCGWLHDAGIASAIRHLDPLIPIGTDSELAAVWPLILRSRSEHACHLGVRLRLPSTLRHFLREYASPVTLATTAPVTGIVFVAEHLAALQGCGFRDEQPVVGLHHHLSVLGLSERDVLPLSRALEERLGAQEIEWESLRFLAGA